MENFYFLKYIRPDEYSQIFDHIRKQSIPLSLTAKDVNTNLDESYVPIDGDNIPIFPGFSFEIEEDLFPLKEFNISFSGL